MKYSNDLKLTYAERYADKRRVARALGRDTKEPECIHHHSRTQLVVCQDTQYHALLHRLHHDYRMAHDPSFAEEWATKYEERMQRQEQVARRECDALRSVFLKMGFTDEELDCEVNRWPGIQAS